MKYSAHGLTIESEIELTPLTQIKTQKNADTWISQEYVSPNGLKNPKKIRPFLQADINVVWLDIPNIARYEISNGTTIKVDPYPEADQQSIRLYIMGSALGAILHQRGHLVLHANAIRIDSGVVVFAGSSGSGKSTTAAVFNQRDYQVITDDVLAIDDKGFSLGGFPQIKLWEDTLKKLDIEQKGLSKIRMQVNKYSLLTKENLDDGVLPIIAIYIISPEHENEQNKFDISPLKGIDKFESLKTHTYRKGMIEGLGIQTHHLKLCANLASSTPISVITRPTGYFNAEELADAVLLDLKQRTVSMLDKPKNNE